jgi:hypothetical protein
MRTVVVDKIASVTQACGLGNEVRVSTENIPSEEGVVIVGNPHEQVHVQHARAHQRPHGQGVRAHRCGALGHRKALFGYSGHVPESVKPGDIIQMLNGGVLGWSTR